MYYQVRMMQMICGHVNDDPELQWCWVESIVLHTQYQNHQNKEACKYYDNIILNECIF